MISFGNISSFFLKSNSVTAKYLIKFINVHIQYDDIEAYTTLKKSRKIQRRLLRKENFHVCNFLIPFFAGEMICY